MVGCGASSLVFFVLECQCQLARLQFSFQILFSFIIFLMAQVVFKKDDVYFRMCSECRPTGSRCVITTSTV